MTCREVFEFLMAYLDGDLPDGERSTFETHLADCPPCKAYLDTYQDAVRLGKDACCGRDESAPPRAPEELVQAILSARRRSDC